MEKEHFLDLTKNYASLTIEDAKAVGALQKLYPYSQVVHCLASRGAKDHQFENATAQLAISAIYSTDRAVLKEIMTAARVLRTKETLVENAVTSHTPRTIDQEEAVAAPPLVTAPIVSADPGLSGDALFDEVMSDLNRLQNLKKLFENSFLEFRKKRPLDTSTAPFKAEPVRRATPEKRVPTEVRQEPKPKASKAPKARPVDLIPEPSSESLLNEIETTRKKVFPDSKKQKEQLQIIDQFISKQPTIAKGVAPKTDAADLTEKSASLTDNMVSETLVEILLRQGKKDKAIEVLRKLIWKFPQKKAIFAAQIEDLRK